MSLYKTFDCKFNSRQEILLGMEINIESVAYWDFPGRVENSTCQCRRLKKLGFDPWVPKIP